MNDEQIDKMKRDLCESVDKLRAYMASLATAENLSGVEPIAAAALAMSAARFCAGVNLLVANDQDYMREIITDEMERRLGRFADVVDALGGDDASIADPELN